MWTRSQSRRRARQWSDGLRRAVLLGAGGGALLVAMSGHSGLAAPLEKDACDALKGEQAKLASAGIRSELQRGAVWGRANLPAERLRSVARLIELDEQILFRCGGAAARQAEADAARAAETGSRLTPQAGKADADAGAEDKPRKIKKPAKRLAKPATEGEAVEEGEATVARKKTTSDVPPKKPAPKAKADDAYRPPEGAPQSVLKPPAGALPAKVE